MLSYLIHKYVERFQYGYYDNDIEKQSSRDICVVTEETLVKKDTVIVITVDINIVRNDQKEIH